MPNRPLSSSAVSPSDPRLSLLTYIDKHPCDVTVEWEADQTSMPPHVPVLYQELLAGLEVRPGGTFIDGTIGAGGHAEGILVASAPDGRLLGLDVDPGALEASRERLKPFKNRVVLVHSNFVYLKEKAEALGLSPADGVLLDLGVSSMQLEDPDRGFSFLREGPLDMRFDPRTLQRAEELVNQLPEEQLAELIYRYGEEPASRVIARAIVAARPVHKTTELASVIREAVSKRRGRRSSRKSRLHPATQTFQALRIAVNAELASLEEGLAGALEVLRPGGRLAVITFHSLEDRIVKRFFTTEARDCICPPEALVCECQHVARVDWVTKRPIRPTEDEICQNPRSRSAKLRVVAKRRA